MACNFSQNGELRHYGVKGMRWGIRRDSNQAPYRKKARIAAMTSAMQKSQQRYIDRLSSKNYLKPKQKERLKEAKAYKKSLDKTMNTLMKDLSPEDVRKGRQSMHLRTGIIATLAGPFATGAYIGSLTNSVLTYGTKNKT